MSFGGSVSSMNSTLKNNRKNLRSKRKGFKDSYDNKTLSSQKLKKIKITNQQLSQIKSEISQRIKKRRKRQTLIFLVTLLMMSTIFLLAILR